MVFGHDVSISSVQRLVVAVSDLLSWFPLSLSDVAVEILWLGVIPAVGASRIHVEPLLVSDC